MINTLLNLGNVGSMKRRTVRSVFITPHKKALIRSTVGHIRKYSPTRMLHNAVTRVKRHVGYYSAPMKAFRYAKRHGVVNSVKLMAMRHILGR